MKRFRGAYVTEWAKISYQVKKDAGWRCVRCGHPNEGSGPHNRIPCDEHCDLERHPESVDFPEVAGQILAYFALVGSPAFTAAGSPPAWPQQRQRVLTVHSEWIRPYIAGYYAWSFLGLDVPLDFFDNHPRWIDRLLDYPHLTKESKKIALELGQML
jgi:hypothetical protein